MTDQPNVPRFTVVPVTPEIERAATQRARQAAEESERSAAWFAAHSAPETDPAKLRERLERAHTENARLSGEIGDLKRELAELRAVARGYCPACGRGDAAPTVEHWEQQRKRAEQAEEFSRRALAQRQEMAEERFAWQQRGDRAEAALARIQRLADEYPAGIDTALVLEALDHTQHATPVHCPCGGVHFPSSDNCRWCKCHRGKPAPDPAATQAADTTKEQHHA